MSILNSLTVYGQNRWIVKSKNDFSSDDIASVKSAEVVASNYGKSVCFHLISGGSTFIPLSKDSKLGVGATIDMKNCSVLTLGKVGEADIYRVIEK